MEFRFQKVRDFIAGLVGSPDLSEKMAVDLDAAIKADEAAAAQLLASGQLNATTSTTTPTATTPTAGATASGTTTEVPTTLDGVLAMVQNLQAQVSSFQQQKTALEQEKTALEHENKQLKEFKDSQSPNRVALQSENNGAAGITRVSKTAEKDAQHIAELTRLAEQYPILMSDII